DFRMSEPVADRRRLARAPHHRRRRRCGGGGMGKIISPPPPGEVVRRDCEASETDGGGEPRASAPHPFASRTTSPKGGGKVMCALVITVLACLSLPATAAPQRIVSTFLCTDEYLLRLVPRSRIAALSFEAGDRKPVVSTIADKVGGIPQIRPSTETVLNLSPDLVV